MPYCDKRSFRYPFNTIISVINRPLTVRTPRHRWQAALQVYARWPVLVLLLLGFSAGLPFLLVGATLSARLADIGVETTAIGFFSWIGIAYSIKVLWAPFVDRLSLPLLDAWLGRRRSWMLLAQVGIAIGLWQMAIIDATAAPTQLALAGLLVAFASATQDVAIDAYRIEIDAPEHQAALSAAYTLGYRLALLVAGAGALVFAEMVSWQASYFWMAALVLVGMVTVLLAREPAQKIKLQADLDLAIATQIAHRAHQHPLLAHLASWIAVALIGPFVDFFRRYGDRSLLILLLIATYRISDVAMGVMVNPFLIKGMGFSKIEIAEVTKVFGFFMTLFGLFVGGLLVARFGVRRILLAGALLTAATNLLFTVIAQFPADTVTLALVISIDNLSNGLATVAFIAWLSGMTSTAFTATQYALFSSLMTLLGKVIGGFSGWMVDLWGYGQFFLMSAVMGLPAILLCLWILGQREGDDPVAPDEAHSS